MGLSPGTQIGAFKILAFIGEGGMGEVYRAKDTKLGRDVAIKRLPAAFAQDRERLMRFKREAKILASLDHSNIGALYDFREENGTYFLVLQLIEGETLAERIERGPIPVKEALPLFVQIAEALEAAHEQGIIHRDLKPSNIKISPEGKLKVLDFGMAKIHRLPKSISPMDPTRTASSARAKVTTDGAILGTPSYMSPEQARGHDVDTRSDIWAFGCCLYEALTGKVPFKGDSVPDTMNAILHYEPDWSALPKDVGRAIVKLLKRCLEKDARSRLRDIGDARIEIREILAGSSVAAPSAIGRSRRHARRKRLGIPAAILVLASVVVGLSVAGYLAFQRDRIDGVQPTALPANEIIVEKPLPPVQILAPIVDEGVTAEQVMEARAAALEVLQQARDVGADEHMPGALAEGQELLEEGEGFMASNDFDLAVEKFDGAKLIFARAGRDSGLISREIEDLELARVAMVQVQSEADNVEASRFATDLYEKAAEEALEASNLNDRVAAARKYELSKALYEQSATQAVRVMRLLLDDETKDRSLPVVSDDSDNKSRTVASVDQETPKTVNPDTSEEGGNSKDEALVVTRAAEDRSKLAARTQSGSPEVTPPKSTGKLTIEVKRARKGLTVARGSHLKVFIDENEIDVEKSIRTSIVLETGPHTLEWSAYDGRGSKEEITIMTGRTILIEIKERNLIFGGKGRVFIDGKEIRRYDW